MYVHHSDALNEMIWDLYYKIGNKWKSHKPENLDWNGKVENEMMRFVIWATDNGYSLKDLKEMAA